VLVPVRLVGFIFPGVQVVDGGNLKRNAMGGSVVFANVYGNARVVKVPLGGGDGVRLAKRAKDGSHFRGLSGCRVLSHTRSIGYPGRKIKPLSWNTYGKFKTPDT